MLYENVPLPTHSILFIKAQGASTREPYCCRSAAYLIMVCLVRMHVVISCHCSFSFQTFGTSNLAISISFSCCWRSSVFIGGCVWPKCPKNVPVRHLFWKAVCMLSWLSVCSIQDSCTVSILFSVSFAL